MIKLNIMKNILFSLAALLIIFSCTPAKEKIPVILDTDANNELDDQHAIAYMIYNDDLFDIRGITTNRTWNGGPVEEHSKEARRIVHLCGADDRIMVISGANGDYMSLKDSVNNPEFDGKQAVDFIIDQARLMPDNQKLVLIPVGKLTNIALALKKDPSIVSKVKVVWLGSNWPGQGEYNMDNDTSAVNPVIKSGVEMWVCTVYGGTMEVRSTKTEIRQRLSGSGKQVDPVEGRHGGSFDRLGDYLLNLWENVDEESRSLFDMAAVATVKNSGWAEPTVAYGPRLINGEWTSDITAKDSVFFFRNYDVDAVMTDFWKTMEKIGQ
jgi:inosine-uridine nucleoside N-ribohydrolase